MQKKRKKHEERINLPASRQTENVSYHHSQSHPLTLLLYIFFCKEREERETDREGDGEMAGPDWVKWKSN